jgi:putative transcriptional regulator
MIKRRKKLGLTQKEVAKRVSIARTTYTNIELGDKNPSLQVALRIKEVLEVEDDDIFLISNVPERNGNHSA